MKNTEVNIVWFKRDLRLQDHLPLQAAEQSGLPVVLCYVFEPSLLQLPEHSPRHWRFIWESLQEMKNELKPFGISLHIFYGDVLLTFQKLHSLFNIQNIYSTQETGMRPTFERDRQIQAFAKAERIGFHTFPEAGIVRGLTDRFKWQEGFEEYAGKPVVKNQLARLQTAKLADDTFTHYTEDMLPKEQMGDPASMQPGGSAKGHRYLQSFCQHRASNYNKHISKPLLSRKSCSRLSPYIAYGNLSARQVWQATELSRAGKPAIDRSMHNFHSRLWWRSHYIQKLESDYKMEWLPINRGFLALEKPLDHHLLNAWKNGETGFPMVDASMKSLRATGYLNFRMRAMLSTFLSFTLWQPWQEAARHLAQIFLDFEPGIHYPQLQMQAGTTGYHPMRIYNPTVQSVRHDPKGEFVKQWLPALKKVPTPLIYEPWKMTAMEQSFYKCKLGTDYPYPVVNFEEATRKRKEQYWAFRQGPEIQQDLPRVWDLLCLPENRVFYEQELWRKSQVES